MNISQEVADAVWSKLPPDVDVSTHEGWQVLADVTRQQPGCENFAPDTHHTKLGALSCKPSVELTQTA